MSRPGRDSRASRRSIARRERVRDRAIGVAGRSGPSVTVSKVRRAGHEWRHERAPTSDRTVECVSLCSTLSRSAAAPRSGGVAWVPCPHHMVRTALHPRGAVVRVRSALVPRDGPWSRLTSTRPTTRRALSPLRSRGWGSTAPRPRVMRYTDIIDKHTTIP
jgi:hypothetical protein